MDTLASHNKLLLQHVHATDTNKRTRGLKEEEYEYLNTSNNGGAGGSGNQDRECMLPLQLGQAEQGYTYIYGCSNVTLTTVALVT